MDREAVRARRRQFPLEKRPELALPSGIRASVDTPQQLASPRPFFPQRIEDHDPTTRDPRKLVHELHETFVGKMVRDRDAHRIVDALVRERKSRGIAEDGREIGSLRSKPIELRRIVVNADIARAGIKERNEVAGSATDVQDVMAARRAERRSKTSRGRLVPEEPLQPVVEAFVFEHTAQDTTPRLVWDLALDEARNPVDERVHGAALTARTLDCLPGNATATRRAREQ